MTSEDLLDFMRSRELAVIATSSGEGRPEAALINVFVTSKYEILFNTLRQSRKVANLRRSPAVALVLSGEHGDERTVQFEGIAHEVSALDMERIWYAGNRQLPPRWRWTMEPGISYWQVVPVWIRMSDYNRNPAVIVDFTADDLAGAGE